LLADGQPDVRREIGMAMAEDRAWLPQAGAQISPRTQGLHKAVLAHADDLLAGARKFLPDLASRGR
jgi:hypothetical protein